MANKVTLYIDDSNIRLMVMRGERIKKYATLPLEPGLVVDNVVLKEDELASGIKKFLRANRVRDKKVIVGLSGLRHLTRPIQLPGLSPSLMNEAVLREAKRVLPVTIEQYYILWQTIPAPAGRTKVFVIAVRCRNADSVINTLKKIGLTVSTLDLKPLALARLVREKTAIILDIQPTEIDIVIVSEGVPQPIRTVSLPREAQTNQQKLLVIKAELDRTVEFYNSNNPDNTLDNSVPLYISGVMNDRSELETTLPSELGYSIIPLSYGAKTDSDNEGMSYAVNFGLAMLDSDAGVKGRPSIVNTNLLPLVYRPKPVSLFRVVAIPGIVTAAAVIVAMVLLARSTSANIESYRNQLDTVDKIVTQEQTKKSELKRELTKAEASYQKLASVLDKLSYRQSETNGNLTVALGIVPWNVKLSAVDYTGGLLTINGLAPEEAVVLDYAHNLETNGRKKEVTVASMKTDENNQIQFRLIVKAVGP